MLCPAFILLRIVAICSARTDQHLPSHIPDFCGCISRFIFNNYFQLMFTPREMFIETIDPCLSFIVAETQPFSVKFCTEAFYGIEIIPGDEYNAA